MTDTQRILTALAKVPNLEPWERNQIRRFASKKTFSKRELTNLHALHNKYFPEVRP